MITSIARLASFSKTRRRFHLVLILSRPQNEHAMKQYTKYLRNSLEFGLRGALRRPLNIRNTFRNF